MLSVIPIRPRGFILLSHEKPSFIIMSGDFFACSALTSCHMKQRCLLFGSRPFYSLFSSLICFFSSYIVTSVTALVFNFLPFAFIYTFAGYRYPMAVALAVVSLYFLHVGFRNGSPFCLSLGGIAAGLCLASSISGKQYLLALAIAAPLYGLCYWRRLKQSVTWTSLALVLYGFLAAAAPILLYIVFNRESLHSTTNPALFAISGMQCSQLRFQSESGLIPNSFGAAFLVSRLSGSLFQILCLFLYHIIGS